MPSLPFRIRRIDHVVPRVRDPARMRAFHRDVPGCTVERHQDEIGLPRPRAGASLIGLVDVTGELRRPDDAAPGAEGHDVNHVRLRVDPCAGDAIRAHLAAHGVAPGEAGSRHGADGEGRSQFLHDPDGNTIEPKGLSDDPAAAVHRIGD